MSAPREIVELVEGFSCRINEYRSSQYNETELRDEFVNPFFTALGWDVHNQQGLSSDSKEVTLEESIRMEESIKNPDYSFRFAQIRLVGEPCRLNSHGLRGVCCLRLQGRA